jgi:pimeloyl-ACP methyl ester carboxylesterase
VVLVVVLVFLSGLPQALFHQSTTTLTPVAASPTHAPTSLATLTTNFLPASCPFKLGSGMMDGQTVKCGYVTVPENRSNPSSATVHLAVAIFKSPNVQNDPYPVIRLEGGPGGPSLDNWARFITSTNFSTFVFNHDLIMFDQRGTGYSTPPLACPETLQLQFDTLNEHLSATDSERLLLHAVGACHDRLVRSSVDLNAFNSIENAADVRDLILALGYKQANLFGVSYGTRLALTTMRLYPSVIRSVVLDSTYPPQKNRTDLPSTAQRVFNVLFQGCAADTNCVTLYPHLDTVFYQLITDLNATPVHFQTTDITTGKSYHVVMAGNDFVFVLFSALYVTQFIPDLPRMVFQVRDHNYTLLSQMYGAVEFNDNFSDGMFYSDECSEDWNFLTQNDIAAAMQGIAPQIRPALQSELQQEYDACQLWHVRQAPAAQKQSVVSAIPTLILSDEYDPITPPANGKLAAQTLKNSYFFLFPGLGHGAEYNSPCVDSIISAFDDNPTQKPSDACIVNMGEPNFV